MGGFNAPRIIGGGQIQQPRQVNAMDQIADATWKAAEMKQKEDDLAAKAKTESELIELEEEKIKEIVSMEEEEEDLK